jgi:hypothetical protein
VKNRVQRKQDSQYYDPEDETTSIEQDFQDRKIITGKLKQANYDRPYRRGMDTRKWQIKRTGK